MFKTKTIWKDEVAKLRELGSTGASMAELARIYGVSRQRMKQVLDKYVPEWRETYGWVVKHSEKVQAYKNRWGERNNSELYRVQRAKFRAKKYNAERTGYTWDIKFGELEWPTHCPILGLELDYFAEFRQENSVSFDRIDSSKGYESGNVQLLSWRANRIKNDGSAKEHRLIADFLDTIEQRSSCGQE